MWRYTACSLAVGALLVGCSGAPVTPFSLETPPVVLAPATSIGIVDGRARFREIFCAVNEAHGDDLPGYRPCEESLWRLADEPRPDGRPVFLGVSRRGLQFLAVPGLGWNCFTQFARPEYSAIDHLNTQGYPTSMIPVDGLGSSPHNAAIIRDAVVALPVSSDKSIVLLGYSKGVPDILETLFLYPEIQAKVAAVVSVAGAVAGSPLADDTPDSLVGLIRATPGSDCSTDERGPLESLRVDTRLGWLARHALPEDIAFFSLAAFAEPESISAALRPSYDRLARIEPRNDGQLIYYHQIIPAGELLGYLNADHWAVAVPAERQYGRSLGTIMSHEEFPREVLLEATARYVEERLAAATSMQSE